MTDQLATLPSTPDASGIDQTRYAYGNLIAKLASSDPPAVLGLAETVTDPGLRRTVYANLIGESYRDPTDSIASRASRAELIATIPDESSRTSILTHFLDAWLREDFVSARAWIESHDTVSPELAAQLITKADPAAP